MYFLDPTHVDPKRIRRERDKARELRASSWWNAQLQKRACHYCGGRFEPAQLTMDHVVPLARGGTSVKSNLVPACSACNASKKLDTPVDRLLHELQEQQKLREWTGLQASDRFNDSSS